MEMKQRSKLARSIKAAACFAPLALFCWLLFASSPLWGLAGSGIDSVRGGFARVLREIGAGMNPHVPDPAFVGSLTRTRLGSSGFEIGLPEGFAIQENRMEDFVVVYLAPTDSAPKINCHAGFYFGNHPSLFEREDGAGKDTVIVSKILGRKVKWSGIVENGRIAIQTLRNHPAPEGWNERIHLFGTADSPADLDRLLDILSTLSRK